MTHTLRRIERLEVRTDANGRIAVCIVAEDVLGEPRVLARYRLSAHQAAALGERLVTAAAHARRGADTPVPP